MSDNTRFWLGCWVIAVLIFSYIVLAISSHHMDRNTKAVEMIRAGADPIEIMCMIDDTAGCILKLAKEEK